MITDHVFRYNPDRKPTTTGVRTGIHPDRCMYLGTCNKPKDDHQYTVNGRRLPAAATTQQGDTPQ